MTALALTPQPASASVLLAVTGAPVLSAAYTHNASGNILTNPSAEVDVTGWLKTSGNSLVRDTTPTPQSGSGIFNWTTAAIGDWAYTSDYAAGPGQTWTASVYVQGSGSAAVRVGFRDASLAVLSQPESATVTLTGAWQRISVTAAAPAGTAYVFLRVMQKTAGALVVSFDAAMLGQSGTLDPYTEMVDSWAGTNAALVGSTLATHTGAGGFQMTPTVYGNIPQAVAKRTVSGLTVGVQYRFTAWHKATPSEGGPGIRLGVTGIGSTGYNASSGTWKLTTYLFIATATSHELLIYEETSRQDTVYLDDLKLEAVAAGYTPFTITRVDANGSTPVRLLAGQEPIAGVLTITDYEPALVGSVRYDVRDAAGVTTSASTVVGATSPWLHVVTLPQYRAQLEYVTGYTGARASLGTVHRPIGRTSPLPVTGALGTREGTLTVWCSTYPQALAVAAVAQSGEVVMFRQPDFPGLDMWAVLTGATINPANPSVAGLRWAVELVFVEIAAPADPLLGAVGWTYSSVATYGTYTAVKAAFTSYAALVAGP